MMAYRVDTNSTIYQQSPRPAQPTLANPTLLQEINAELDKRAYPWALHEPFLETRVAQLEALTPVPAGGYWLTLARLMELALLCAGHYADHNEAEAVGDLLANPPRILVHLPNRAEPVLKRRHSKLTDQFAAGATTRAEVIEWLKTRTVLQIEQQPLLPRLYERLRDSGAFMTNYLDSVARRMQRITEVIGLLASCHIPEGISMYEYMLQVREQDREFVESRLCRFDTHLFHQLGREIEQVLENQPYASEFLRDSCLV